MAEQAEPNCVWDNKVKFCQIANEWFVGTNSSNQKANAVESTDDIQGLLIIPSEVNGHQITQIGQYAFFECRLITRLIIKARITSIHYRGFSHCDKIEYVYSDAELQDAINRVGKGYTLQRYKGLGEMNPEQLWQTTMDPQKRSLMQVSVDDAANAELLITTLMGDNIEARKSYISEHANFNREDKFAGN